MDTPRAEHNPAATHAFMRVSTSGLSAKIPANLRLVQEEKAGPNIKMSFGDRPIDFIYRHAILKWWPGQRIEWFAKQSSGQPDKLLLPWGLNTEWKVGQQLGGVLWEFVRLADASAEQIYEFAGRYGLLGVLGSGLPQPSAEESWRFWDFTVYRDFSSPTPITHIGFYERIASWRAYARMLRACLNLNSALRGRMRGSLSDWQQLTAFPMKFLPENGPKKFRDTSKLDLSARRAVRMEEFSILHPEMPGWIPEHLPLTKEALEARQLVFSECISLLMRAVGLEPTLTFANGTGSQSPGLAMGMRKENEGAVLLPVLVQQLIIVLTSQQSQSPEVVAECSSCGNPYLAKRRPRKDRNHYCPQCQQDAQLAAKRNSYHSNKDRWPSTSNRGKGSQAQT